ncbi:MAG: hypothetical protein B7Z33_00800 [Sphingomonadales bacterium 12-68-11]|nr:MAG: hypothetical protein B7Z33_00800 [Sphingomonadales bacterium 12-68-11]OYX16945.1 MAG: hypothetical protein B7Z07_01465 [Sphingomonadales bacterium 32-67-7]
MRRVFFSFHFQRDSFKVSQVRNSWIGNSNFEGQPYLDKAAWEQIQRRGPAAIKNWIDSQMNGTSVTIVLIGAETLQRPWVQYEVSKTLERRAGLLGVSLAGMTNIDRTVEWKSSPTAGTPFEAKSYGSYPVYNWAADNGRANLGGWIEQAAVRAGR